MLKGILTILIIAASVVIVLSFFMPWAKVSVSAMGISKELATLAGTKLKDTPAAGKVADRLKSITGAISSFGDIDVKTTITGYHIPQMVNNKTSKVALSLTQILFRSTKGLDLKSYLVYLVPALGILCGLLAIFGLAKRSYVVLVIIISGVVSGAGLYNLYTADLGSVALKITIAEGLWNSMYAFAFIFLAGILWFISDKKA